jgi:hypothetical protein
MKIRKKYLIFGAVLCQLGASNAFVPRQKIMRTGWVKTFSSKEEEEEDAGVKAEPGISESSTPVNEASLANEPAAAEDPLTVESAWETSAPIKVQGGSLRTWSFLDQNIESVQVLMKTDGRPLNANIDLWQGPDNTPERIGVYIENGNVRPFCCVIATPMTPNSVAIRNTGQLEFPLDACVEADDGSGFDSMTKSLDATALPQKIQGGAIRSYSFSHVVESVQILLKTDGRPLNARIEVLQGPNNNKQVIELYTEDGEIRPFFAVVETPGSGYVVRVLNTAPVEFPILARVEPYLVKPGSEGQVVVSDDGPLSYGRLLDR